MKCKTLRRNHLYRLRRSRRLEQKHLAVLLGYRGPAMISRMETGAVLPSVQNGLLLEMALGARLPEIYIDLHRALEELILKRAAKLPEGLRRDLRGRLLGEDSR